MVTVFDYLVQALDPGEVDEGIDGWMLAPDELEQQVGSARDEPGTRGPFGEDRQRFGDRGWSYIPVEQQPVALHLMELHDNSVRPL
jgi:hypothetical protein